MRWYWKVIIGVFATVILGANALFTWVDRTPFQDRKEYQQTISVLNRYYEYRDITPQDSLKIGWAQLSLIPQQDIQTIPLAGYGARKPKEAESIHDSVNVKTIVISTSETKIALVSAELLIIHPEVALGVYRHLEKHGWSSSDIYFGATHSHSSIGGWAPGITGDLIAGTHQTELTRFISTQIANSILIAENNLSVGTFSFAEIESPTYIRNRLVGNKGIIDPHLKVLVFRNEQGSAIDITYGAHATCLGPQWKKVAGDYPYLLTESIERDSIYELASFRAGAVASMGTGPSDQSQMELANWMSVGIKEELSLLQMLPPTPFPKASIESYKIPLYLGDPQLKISTNLCLRPWLFRQLVGEYPVDIAVASIGEVLMVGLPCDFSGELAMPLYQYARERGITLIINSFNGGYIGYIPKDEWYDLNKYETRSMAWYGHDMGAYVSDLIIKIIDHHKK